jgi:hypothetical protein
MDDPNEDPHFGLVDLIDVLLPELQRRDDSAFSHCLNRIIAENDDPEALTVVAFQSAV